MTRDINEYRCVSRFFRQIEPDFLSTPIAPGRTRKQQQDWWYNCYCPRANEDEIFFREFLSDPRSSICIVTGQVGAGKTSFVLDKLENPLTKVADGIRIDIGHYASEFEDVKLKATEEYPRMKDDINPIMPPGQWLFSRLSNKLCEMIIQEIERRFRQHFWQIFYMGLDPKYLFVDIRYDLAVDYYEATDEDLEKNAGKINAAVAAALCLVRPGNDEVNLRSKLFTEQSNESSRKERFNTIYEYLLDHPHIADHIRSFNNPENLSAEVKNWLSAYARFFKPENPILILDNVDHVLSPVMHSIVVQYARNLGRQLRYFRPRGEKKNESERDTSHVFKIVFTIRDWNLDSSLVIAGDDAVIDTLITIGEYGKGFSKTEIINGRRPVYIENSTELIPDIISRRLEFVENEIKTWITRSEMEYNHIQESISDDLKEKLNRMKKLTYISFSTLSNRLGIVERQEQQLLIKLYKEISYADEEKLFSKSAKELFRVFHLIAEKVKQEILNELEEPMVFELNNQSIRNALSVVLYISRCIMDKFHNDHGSINLLLKSGVGFGLRSYAIDWLFEEHATRHDLKEFINEAKREVASDSPKYLCCPHRMVLTLLNNLDRRYGGSATHYTIYVSDIINQLYDHIGLPKDEIRLALLHLFWGHGIQASYITIYQDGLQLIDSRQEILTNKQPTIANLADSAQVHINPRGRALINNIIPKIDYWIRLTERCDYRKHFFETVPEEALIIASSILAVLKKMVKAHERNWATIVEKYLKGVPEKGHPFDALKQANLVTGDAFYLERVASSHADSIDLYIKALMGIDNLDIIMHKSDYGKFRTRWPKNAEFSKIKLIRNVKELLRTMEEYEKDLNEQNRSTLHDLYDLGREFFDIHNRLHTLQNKTYTEIISEIKTGMYNVQ